MGSFILTLDTTPPVLTLNIPETAIYGKSIRAEIVSNEEFEIIECYLIDSTGTKQNIVPMVSGQIAEKYINVDALAAGTCTFYITVEDTVGNRTSEIASSFVISNGTTGYITVTASTAGITISYTSLALAVTKDVLNITTSIESLGYITISAYEKLKIEVTIDD